jgi:hypothetical protein
MRFADTVGEAFRNVREGVARALLVVVGLAGITAGAAWLDGSSVAAVMTQAAQYRTGGGSTWVVSAPAGVDGERCDALSELPQVTAAGALRGSSQGIRFATLPSLAVETFQATPGLAHLLTGEVRGSGSILLSSRLASDLGVDRPEWVRTTTGRTPILEYAAVSFAADPAPFDACWISVWPPDAGLASRLRNLPLGDTADPEQVEFGTLNSALGTRLDPAADFQARSTRYVGAAAGLLAFVVVLAVGMRRRLEYASARHAGLSRADLVRIALAEAVGWGSVLLMLQVAIGVLLACSLGADEPGLVLEAALRVAAFVLIGGVLGAMALPAFASERRLIELFKGRT